jgi:hypothetical protein
MSQSKSPYNLHSIYLQRVYISFSISQIRPPSICLHWHYFVHISMFQTASAKEVLIIKTTIHDSMNQMIQVQTYEGPFFTCSHVAWSKSVSSSVAEVLVEVSISDSPLNTIRRGRSCLTLPIWHVSFRTHNKITLCVKMCVDMTILTQKCDALNRSAIVCQMGNVNKIRFTTTLFMVFIVTHPTMRHMPTLHWWSTSWSLV